MTNLLTFNCPHCGDQFVVYENELNCRIFRHAYFKDTMTQINPHASKETIEGYKRESKIYGCGGPFIILSTVGPYEIKICDYI